MKCSSVPEMLPVRRLRVFSDPSYLPAGTEPLPLLRPFWGCVQEEPNPLNAGRFDDYYEMAPDLFEMTPLNACDLVLFPAEWAPGRSNTEAKRMAQVAQGHQKPYVIMSISDSDKPIPIPNATVFRTSLYASKRKRNEYAIPCWSVDFRAKYGEGWPQELEKTEMPIVGYTGYVDYLPGSHPLSTLKRRLLARFRAHIGARARGTAVRALMSHSGIETRFTFRQGGMTGLATEEERREFADNIFGSHYSLVCRGGGNYSYRLYEVLSCGRIPLFVNTDCVLPYDHLVNWRECMLWVEYSDIRSIGDRVAHFHENVTDAQFRALQRAARRVYDTWIKPSAFYANIWRCIPGLQQ